MASVGGPSEQAGACVRDDAHKWHRASDGTKWEGAQYEPPKVTPKEDSSGAAVAKPEAVKAEAKPTKDGASAEPGVPRIDEDDAAVDLPRGARIGRKSEALQGSLPEQAKQGEPPPGIGD